MLEAKTKAAFSFASYKVNKFSLKEPSGDHNEVNVSFQPSGIYFESQKLYKLFFDFSAFYGEQRSEFITATVVADFLFESSLRLEEIPDYFYSNSIAIVFPHLRAFITTITAVANIKPLILPVLNLSFLESEMKKNTTLQP